MVDGVKSLSYWGGRSFFCLIGMSCSPGNAEGEAAFNRDEVAEAGRGEGGQRDVRQR
jgi:hypothetical protein